MARIYAEIYAYFIKPRNKASTNVHDLQIGATALAHSYPLLTSNIQDFEPTFRSKIKNKTPNIIYPSSQVEFSAYPSYW